MITQVHDNSTAQLPLMESFYTIQGEGYYSGRAAYFIRLGGCDVGCVWCDVKESWEKEKHPWTPIEKMVAEAVSSGTRLVVITGGEPAMYNLSELVNQLHSNQLEVAIETSGAYAFNGNVDWYCFSPKKFKAPVEEAYKRANELKVVVYHPSDFEWAEKHATLVQPDCQLYLQPEWSKQERFLPEIIAYVKDNPKWKISLQTHKLMNIP
jgi:7-carboxy-7-deazaguanine synthase